MRVHTASTSWSKHACAHSIHIMEQTCVCTQHPRHGANMRVHTASTSWSKHACAHSIHVMEQTCVCTQHPSHEQTCMCTQHPRHGANMRVHTASTSWSKHQNHWRMCHILLTGIIRPQDKLGKVCQHTVKIELQKSVKNKIKNHSLQCLYCSFNQRWRWYQQGRATLSLSFAVISLPRWKSGAWYFWKIFSNLNEAVPCHLADECQTR